MAQDFLEWDLDTFPLQLRQQAEHQFVVSPDYDLNVNDYQENTMRGTGKGEAVFLWVKGFKRGVMTPFLPRSPGTATC
ncbi:hypothetical protein NKT34_09980 [Paenibacillus polysaccharolyticus]|uniref:hypothetical protein n=1 Tax=Paenibacillus polysaccharolyticus TaxID=582692 RepID=UPI00209F48DF|nr:hypothetical protein [Paenibacillus polysaccharolyticus]MCP1133620.1 hypothetical protein [Paenibacillus polysaccharolyticus]